MAPTGVLPALPAVGHTPTHARRRWCNATSSPWLRTRRRRTLPPGSGVLFIVLLLANPVYCNEPDTANDSGTADESEEDGDNESHESNGTNDTNETSNESVEANSSNASTPEVFYDCSIQVSLLSEGMTWDNCSSVSDLAHRSVCSLTCIAGYTLIGDGLLNCENGTLQNSTSCVPSPCPTIGELPFEGGPGDCPDVLASGSVCTPECRFGFIPNSTYHSQMTCEFGVLTEIDCVEMPPRECPPGQHQTNYTECKECPSGKYKVGLGPGPCIWCPDNAVTDGPGGKSQAACICESTMYPNRSSDTGELLACEACPNNSRIEGGWRPSATVDDCKCADGYVRVPEFPEPLLYCRLPYACEARAWLVESNLTVLTSNKPHVLKLGKCADYVNDTDGLMPHGSSCRLFCASERLHNWPPTG